MRKERRLTRQADFSAVRRRGRSWADGLLVLLARRNSLAVTRFGFSVGKRTGNAVEFTAGRDHWWHELDADSSDTCPAEKLDSEHPLYVL